MSQGNIPQTQAGAPPVKIGPGVALLLSALILPGLGQLLTGRLAKGAAMALMAGLWFVVALIKIMRDLMKIAPQMAEKTLAGIQLTIVDYQEALRPMAEDLTWVLTPILLIWLWSLIDSFKYLFSLNRAGGQTD